MISFNEVLVKACEDSGVEYFSWYPITPASGFSKEAAKVFKNIRAEDEIAAINMALGASIIGKTSFTATSGPGINLMTEAINYAFMAEIPIVIFDFQRKGPATGIPTKSGHEDENYLNNCIFGINKNPVFKPKTQEECYSMTIDAFKMAEELKRPVFVLLDFDLANTYETEINLKRSKLKLKKDRKKYYTGLYTYENIISSDVEKLNRWIKEKQNEFLSRL